MLKRPAVTALGLIGVLVLAASAGQLLAGERGHGHGQRHHRMHGDAVRQFADRYDTNKDGKITQTEIDQNRTLWHGEFDLDKDTLLTMQEFERLWLKARRLAMVREFQKFDRDGDGKVTLEEYKLPLAELVERRDRNGDGALSKEDRPSPGSRRHDKGPAHEDNQDEDDQGSSQNDG